MRKKEAILSSGSLSLFCAQAALLLKAGIPLQSGLSDLAEHADDEQYKAALARVDHGLASGLSLSQAMEQSQAFPRYALEMAHLAETSGRLEEVMNTLSLYYERQEAFASRLRSAVLYPSILIAIVSLVIIAMITLVLPVFRQVFAQLSGGLPQQEYASISTGITISRIALVVLLCTLAAIGLVALLYRIPKIKSALMAFFRRFFLTRRLLSRLSSNRFLGGMELIQKSGMPPSRSILLSLPLLDMPEQQAILEKSQSDPDAGEDWIGALRSADIISGMEARLLRVGRETGSTEQVLSKIVQRSDDDVVEALNRLLATAEPALISVLAVIIGLIMISVMLPLIGLLSALG